MRTTGARVAFKEAVKETLDSKRLKQVLERFHSKMAELGVRLTDNGRIGFDAKKYNPEHGIDVIASMMIGALWATPGVSLMSWYQLYSM